MRPLIKKLYLFGFLFIISTILLSFPIAIASAQFVSENFTHQLHLDLLGFDSIWTVLTFATIGVLGITGFIILIVAASTDIIDKLAQLILMHRPLP